MSGKIFNPCADIAESNELAKDYTLWWNIYASLFPDDLVEVEHCPERKWQHQGIDRLVHLRLGNRFWVEEKCNKTYTGNIVLEVWSNYQRRTPGWILGHKRCDLFCWVERETHRAYLWNYIALCALYEERKWQWAADASGVHRRVTAHNKCKGYQYDTVSVTVPLEEICESISTREGWF